MRRNFIYALPCAIVHLLLSQVVAIPPLVFPPSQNWDGIDGTWSSFSIRLGNPEQVVRVLPSTSGYNVIVPIAPGACNSTSDYNACVTARGGLFDPTGSKTWQDQGDFGVGMQANLGYGALNGDFGLDKVGLGIVTDPNVTFANQVIGGIWGNDFYLGLFGLGTQPTNFTDFTDSHASFFTSLRASNNTPSYSWSYTAGAKYQLTGVLGTMIFGGYDSSKFTPNNLTIPMTPDVSRDLVVGLQSITASWSAGSKLLMPSGGIFTFVDSTLPYLWLPEDACKAFEDAFGLVWDNRTELYLVNDTLHDSLSKLNPTFTFRIGIGKAGGEFIDLAIPYDSFDLEAKPPLVSNTTRYFPLKRAADDTQYTLGRAFLQETYLIADYERQNFSLSQCIFDAGAKSNIVTIDSIADAASSTNKPSNKPPKTTSKSSGISGGAIGGIVVAAVIIVAGLLGLTYFLRKNRKWPFNLPPSELEGPSSEGADGQADYSTDPAVALMKPHAAEAMSSPLSEMQDVHPVAGFFAKEGRYEMAVMEPTAAEVDAPAVHEMFDESAYREMHSVTSSQARGSLRSGMSAQPLSEVSDPVLPDYEASNIYRDEITPVSRVDTPERKGANKEEE